MVILKAQSNKTKDLSTSSDAPAIQWLNRPEIIDDQIAIFILQPAEKFHIFRMDWHWHSIDDPLNDLKYRYYSLDFIFLS